MLSNNCSNNHNHITISCYNKKLLDWPSQRLSWLCFLGPPVGASPSFGPWPPSPAPPWPRPSRSWSPSRATPGRCRARSGTWRGAPTAWRNNCWSCKPGPPGGQKNGFWGVKWCKIWRVLRNVKPFVQTLNLTEPSTTSSSTKLRFEKNELFFRRHTISVRCFVCLWHFWEFPPRQDGFTWPRSVFLYLGTVHSGIATFMRHWLLQNDEKVHIYDIYI